MYGMGPSFLRAGRQLKRIRLKIKCWKCGREELIVELHDEKVVDVNLDKQCPVCRDAWMTRSEMMIEKR